MVGDALDARHAVTSTPYDMVVCDVGLPGPESGLDWCQWLRSAQIWTPVLLLTARSEVEDRITGLDCGADDYLAKPFAFGELTARLGVLQRRGDTLRPTTLRVGDLELDPAEHRLTWQGEPVALSPRELALLDYFMRGRATSCGGPRSSTTCGTTRTTAPPTSLTSTSATCAAGSAMPASARSSRPSAASATG